MNDMLTKPTDEEREIFNDWKRLVDRIYDDPEMQAILCDYDKFRKWEDEQRDRVIEECSISVSYFIEIHLKVTGYRSAKPCKHRNEPQQGSFSSTDE